MRDTHADDLDTTRVLLARLESALVVGVATVNQLSDNELASVRKHLSNVHAASAWLMETLHAKYGQAYPLPYMSLDGETLFPPPFLLVPSAPRPLGG